MTTGTLEAGAIPSRLAVARLAIGAAITLFVITRVYLLLLFVAHGTDLFIYFNYAVRGVDLGQSAYRDFAVEYPPLAYWLMTVPRHLAAERLAAGDLNQADVVGPAFGAFAFAFRALMLLADALSFALICRVARRLNPRSVSWVAWGYLAITTTMHQFLYDRLDIGLLLLLLVWAHGRVAASGQTALTSGNILSYVAIGLSVPYKLVGLFVLPLVLWGDWLAEGGDWRAARRVFWLGLAGAAAAAVPFLVQGLWSGGDVFGFLAYHGQRGIEIESTYASLLLLGSLLGLPLSAEVSHGSVDVVTPVSGLLAKLSPLVLLLGLAVLGWELWRRRPLDRLAVYRAGLLAVPLTLLCSKVLSAQYFLFGLPLLLLLAAEWDQRRLARMTALCFVLAALTASVFPYLWFPTFPGTGITNPFCLFPDLHPVPCLVLALRNGLLAIAWLVSWRATARAGVETQGGWQAGRQAPQVAGKLIEKSASAPDMSRRIHAHRERPLPSWSESVALGFYTLLGILLKLTHGHFHDLGLLLLTLGFLAYVVLGGRSAGRGRGRSTWRVMAQRCGLVAVVFAGLQWLDPELIYATAPGWQSWLAPLGSGLLALALLLWLSTWKRVRLPGRLEHAMWLAAVVLAIALRVVAWHASPQPAIDVWVIGNLGSDQLLSGNNPYTAEYPNVYGDAYDHQPHFFYWPGYLLAAAPFRAVLGDVRAATVAADVLIVVCLLAAGRSLRLPRKTVRLISLLWLLHPVSLFVLEQAWIDPLLLGGVAMLVVCLQRNWWAGAGVALAMVVGMKQYGLLIAWLTLVYLWTHRGALPVAPNWRSLLLAGGLTTAALFGPFLWLDAAAFYASTLEPYLAVELRSDALSIPALIYNGWGVRVSDRILGALALSAIGCVSLALARNRCDLAHLLWASAVALGAFFLLGKLAFCNYYYLVSSLVLWHLLLLLAPSRLLDAERRLVFRGKQPSAAR